MILVIPMRLKAPGAALVEVVFDRGRDGGGILGQTEGDAGGVKPLGEDLCDGFPEAVDLDISTKGERQFLDSGECGIGGLGDHGDWWWWLEGVAAAG